MHKAKKLVKICGITRVDQALQVAQLGINAIGIISVKESPRYVYPANQQVIFESIKRFAHNIKRVTVVKNELLENLIENFSKKNFSNVIQLHGDEDLDYCMNLKNQLPDIEIWKAFRINNKKDIEKIHPYEKYVDAILLDSWNKATYGGSGKRIQQKYIEGLNFNRPWWLAGGVSIDWIENILKNINPDGIDISSSIEISPGIKDIIKAKNILEEINK